MRQKRLFLDLFAGAGGLSEGFVLAGFEPVAHVESDKAALAELVRSKIPTATTSEVSLNKPMKMLTKGAITIFKLCGSSTLKVVAQ